MKRALVGTALGRFALGARDLLEYAAAALSSLERTGTAANDRLARILLVRLCRAGRTFLDVGAHIGSVVDEVSRLCPQSKVVAFEAIPEKVEHLRRRFPRVAVHGCALGEDDGEVSFFVDLKRSGYSSLGRPATGSDSGSTEIKVPLRRLDSVVSEAEDVDFVKIDVEGAELGVLRGGENLVGRCRPLILFESGPQKDDGLGYTKDALWDWLACHDYAVIVPNRLAHNDPGLSREGFAESHLHPRRTTDYFAVPREKRDEARDRARAILGLPTAGG